MNVTISHSAPQSSGADNLHTIFIHGFGTSANDMAHVANEMRNRHPIAKKSHQWFVNYDPVFTSVTDSAGNIFDAFRNNKEYAGRPVGQAAVIFGYSMGGVIGRHLVAKGLAQGLVTTCSPHLGLGDWMTEPQWWENLIAVLFPHGNRPADILDFARMGVRGLPGPASLIASDKSLRH